MRVVGRKKRMRSRRLGRRGRLLGRAGLFGGLRGRGRTVVGVRERCVLVIISFPLKEYGPPSGQALGVGEEHEHEVEHLHLHRYAYWHDLPFRHDPAARVQMSRPR